MKKENDMIGETFNFVEGIGGDIWGPTGKVVAKVCVEDLTTDDANRLVRAILAGLNAEFNTPRASKPSFNVPPKK
jgi:hypothetical protein